MNTDHTIVSDILGRTHLPARLMGRVGIMTLLALGVYGCDLAPTSDAISAETAAAPVYVDSILPIEEEVRRFKAAIGDSVSALTGGATSAEELVHGFVEALNRADVESLQRMTVTAEEFAYLYYPHTQYTTRPYEMSPALVWFQIENSGVRGLDRALARFTPATPLTIVGFECPDAPRVEGMNRVWADCVVQVAEPSGTEVNLSVFGAILERDGAFKFLNYANSI